MQIVDVMAVDAVKEFIPNSIEYTKKNASYIIFHLENSFKLN